MLRDELQDAAVAAAKSYSHSQVEPRHVYLAIARRYRERAEVAALIQAARNAMEPHGGASSTPALTPEAVALLQSITTEKEAIDALVAALGGTQATQAGAKLPNNPEQGRGLEANPAMASGSSAATGTEPMSAILEELEGLIGLSSVKAQVRSVVAVVQANQERTRAGMAPINPSLHLVFTGPPGTGKTTVARLVARLYASAGAIPGSNFTETSRADLVAGYVGQTALKTAEVINRTKPGVLLIDEAYALAPSHESDYGSEAIATLVKAMEDYRTTFAVIAAGYADQMADFIGSNPGLRSRFKTYIDFPNYEPAELTRIFQSFAQHSAIGVTSGVLERAAEIFDVERVRPDFGNARFARSLFEHGYSRMAARAAADGRVEITELMTMQVEDLDWKSELLERKTTRIGFGETTRN